MQDLIDYILMHKLETEQGGFVGLECDYIDSIWCRIPTMVNRCLVTILIIGLILISCLIYRRNMGEKGLGKKILKWNLIFCLIVFLLWFLFSLVVREIGPVCVACKMI